MRAAWPLLNEADIIVGHNIDQFDIKKLNTRFLMHKMDPPSPYKTVDTLKIARRHFAFTSNKLNDLGEMLGLGKKIDTGGFKLWEECLDGKKSSWKKMVAYCSQDVRLLERVYHALLPYASGMPNIAVYKDEKVCPKCGSNKIVQQGFSYTTSAKFQRWICQDCGSWSRERSRIKPKSKTLSNI